MLANPSFENGWTNIGPFPGNLTNQVPNGWTLAIVPIGGQLYDSTDTAAGIPECVHKLHTQLPPEEQLGGAKALILHGTHVYKIFHHGAAFAAELSQTVAGLTPGATMRLTVPIQVHLHGDIDHYAAESGAWVNGKGGWVAGGQMGNRKWYSHVVDFTVPADGVARVVIRVKSKWNKPKDFFFDNLALTVLSAPAPAPTPPVPTPEPAPPPAPKHKAIVLKLPQEATADEWRRAANYAFDFRHTITASHDDALTILRGGNAESFVKVVSPSRPSQQETIKLIQAAGYTWQEVTLPFESSPLAGLKFEQPLDTGWRISSAFNAPRDYSSFGGKKNDRHEGLDVAPIVTGTSHVLAMYPGKVVKIAASAGYGNYVITEHSYGGRTFHLWRAHLATVMVAVGQQVAASTRIGICGSTGNASGRHDHCTMQAAGIGLAGYIVANVIDPTPFYPAPGAAATVDLLPYLRGDGRLYEVRNAAGGQERFQTQVGVKLWYQTKNAAWEELYHDGDFIYRDRDMSPGGGRFYRLIDTSTSQPGSRWIPRHWRAGGEFVQTRRVQFYHKSNCQPSAENSGVVTDTMRFVARHTEYTFRTGVKLPDVVELLWVNGGERYWYARSFGLVAWERLHQDPQTPQWSAVAEIHAAGSRPNNVRESISCI